MHLEEIRCPVPAPPPPCGLHVDRLYPEIKGERYDELCEVDPLYEDLNMDATPQNYVASIHNLFPSSTDYKDDRKRHDVTKTNQ